MTREEIEKIVDEAIKKGYDVNIEHKETDESYNKWFGIAFCFFCMMCAVGLWSKYDYAPKCEKCLEMCVKKDIK